MNKLPEGWEWKKLGEVCEKTDNFSWNNYRGEKQYIDLTSVSRELLEVTDCQIINSKNAPSRAKKNVSTNDVIFATTRPTLKRVTIIKSEYNDSICSTGFVVLRGKSDKIMPEWIYHIILTEPFMKYVKVMQKGASYPAITDNEVKNYVIPLPPLVEQKRIVVILDEAFAAIDKAKANAEKNLANAKELFESYLNGIFDPSTRSGQRNPGEEHRTEPAEVWEEKKLGDIGKVLMCKRIFKNQTSKSGDVPFYKIGTFGKKANAYISQELYKEYRNKYSFPKKGDILLSASGTIGRRVKYDGKPAYFQDSNIVWIDNDEKQVLNDYLYHFYSACKWKSTNGATISRLYNDNLRQIDISFPRSKEKQQLIINKIDKISSEIKNLESIYQQKISDLEELKKSILKKAFEGEL